MASVYARGQQLWCRVKVGGKWESKRTPFRVGGEAKAERYASAAQAAIDKREREQGAGAIPAGPMTVKRYAAEWLPRREAAGIDWKKDRSILKNHVLPALGSMLLAEVRPAHVAELVHRLRFEKKVAPRTVHNIYSSMSAMFRDAAIADHIAASPCILKHPQLGPIIDKDPEWRAGSLFTRDEAEQMISDARIPADRRLVYGFGLLAGLRPGEIGALRWRHYDAAAEPLGRLQIALAYSSKRGIVKGTKTGSSKTIPVHATLAAMLAEWRPSGLVIDDGADPLVIEHRVTHTKPRRSAFDGYDRGPHWRQTCAEVAKLRVSRRSLATGLATVVPISDNLAILPGSPFGRLHQPSSQVGRKTQPVLIPEPLAEREVA
jgi:integrase